MSALSIDGWKTTLAVGDFVILPNGCESVVAAIDLDDGQIMDDCGGWHDAREVDPIGNRKVAA